MAEFTAKDVQEVRQATGAGMLDCKKALEETSGDKEAAKQLLREKGLAASAKRSDRENTQGAVALVINGDAAAMVELKCETDFVAKSDQFNAVAKELAQAVLAGGPDAASQRSGDLDELKITLKENIELGRVVQFVKGAGNVLDSYLHVQSDRGVNGVLVETSGTSQEIAHDIAVHIAFARPKYLSRDEVPAADVEKERATLEAITRNEGKPEQAIPKIVEGRLNGYFKELCLLDQPFAKDDKKSVSEVLGGGSIVRFSQIEIGA
jgi:elongation factor Ts